LVDWFGTGSKELPTEAFGAIHLSKLNLKTCNRIVVLNAPHSFEAELAARFRRVEHIKKMTRASEHRMTVQGKARPATR
jgi:hypothetical protein